MLDFRSGKLKVCRNHISLPLLQGEVARRNDETEGINANDKDIIRNLFFDNPSVSFADSSLYTREPKNFSKI